jgi:hypothetical protein
MFSFELTGAAVTPAAIQNYLGRLKEDAENTGDQREMKKAKLTASFLDTLSSLASDSEEVLDRQFIMEAFRDLWRGVQAGAVPVLPSESDAVNEDSDEDSGDGEGDGQGDGDGDGDGEGEGEGEVDGEGEGEGEGDGEGDGDGKGDDEGNGDGEGNGEGDGGGEGDGEGAGSGEGEDGDMS